MPSGELPYPVFVFAGLLPWSFFATAIANAGNSVVGSERLITKIYFRAWLCLSRRWRRRWSILSSPLACSWC